MIGMQKISLIFFSVMLVGILSMAGSFSVWATVFQSLRPARISSEQGIDKPYLFDGIGDF
jgi:hypothetical protein